MTASAPTKTVVGWAAVSSLVIAPAVVLLAELAFDKVHVFEVSVGALVATFFFAVTGFVGAVFRSSPQLKSALIQSYVAKLGVLIAAAYGLASLGIDRNAFAVSVVVSAIAYLVVQSVLLAKHIDS